MWAFSIVLGSIAQTISCGPFNLNALFLLKFSKTYIYWEVAETKPRRLGFKVYAYKIARAKMRSRRRPVDGALNYTAQFAKLKEKAIASI